MSKLYRKVKLFWTFHYERDWLEEMALKGFMLEDVKMGIVYYFRKESPKQMLYEVDRFNLKKNPTQEEMLAKSNFIEMAAESGWREVTHDESLNYYFTKEYEQDGFNELYNDEESMQIRADKYKKFYSDAGRLMVKMIFLVGLTMLFMDMLSGEEKYIQIYKIVASAYIVITSLLSCMYFKVADCMYEDMKMSREELQKRKEKQIRKERRLIMTSKGLQKYLKKHALQGEKLVSLGVIKYVFEKTENRAVDFVLDTKGMVNERRKKEGMKKLSDSKDWNLMGNDWQAESILYARSHGLECLCAFDNRAIIYQVYDEKDIPEDMKKQRVRLFSIIGGTGTLMLIGGIFGFIIGMLSAMNG